MFNTISSVDPGSRLEGRVLPGDELRYINRHEIHDVLDYKYWAYDRSLTLEFRDAGTIRLRKKEGEDLGLNFETYLMDKPTGCSNRCIFCFIDQLPRGLRKTLYFKDDDARLSFLTGNYITCTNLSERELQRICDLKVSPLNISVHATDPELRAKLIGNPRGREIMDILRRFAAAGIFMECQIVAVPGWNDGAALQRSLEDLAGLYPPPSPLIRPSRRARRSRRWSRSRRSALKNTAVTFSTAAMKCICAPVFLCRRTNITKTMPSLKTA